MFKKLKLLFKKPRSVQEIFDAVIDGGFYTEREDLMCFSLRGAYSEGVISKKEMRIAGRSIKSYLGRRYSLESLLLDHGFPRKFSDRLAIYRDWKNRPSFDGKRYGQKPLRGSVRACSTHTYAMP